MIICSILSTNVYFFKVEKKNYFTEAFFGKPSVWTRWIDCLPAKNKRFLRQCPHVYEEDLRPANANLRPLYIPLRLCSQGPTISSDSDYVCPYNRGEDLEDWGNNGMLWVLERAHQDTSQSHHERPEAVAGCPKSLQNASLFNEDILKKIHQLVLTKIRNASVEDDGSTSGVGGLRFSTLSSKYVGEFSRHLDKNLTRPTVKYGMVTCNDAHQAKITAVPFNLIDNASLGRKLIAKILEIKPNVLNCLPMQTIPTVISG